MDRAVDGEQVAASLADRLAAVTFVDLSADEVTALLVDSIVEWAVDQGWRAYRRAPSVMPLPPPYSHRHSWIDVGCARPDGTPIAVEIDRTGRQRTVDKLLAEAEAGRLAIWVRWGTGRFAAPPPPVEMVTLEVTARRASGGSGASVASGGSGGSGAGRSGGSGGSGSVGSGGSGEKGQRFSRQPARERPAPAHTAAALKTDEQPDLFAGPA
ncbi:hypothetical protein [Phytohabitans aurantiacus]|uniref:DUF559 domain-containing protein n=1 Tax=Phytohabitans aurantiacus TaxID=3016789 RepID=A0ABQ5R2R5_9ACTN|nr:hypothetical protein [Phytohabitans aurantiacus]GLI00836.1 hypothetical protein Pa4123_61120 [Phytohabitans aurantiacus]